MSTQNKAGDRVRAYFIECEKLVYANGLETQLTNVLTVPRAKVEAQKMCVSQLRELKRNNLVSIRTGHSTFYTKAQVLEMAMYATSDNAKELIRHAFDVTEAVYKGDRQSSND